MNTSSMLSSISYSEVNKELIVVFNSGGMYIYMNVPLEIYEEMEKADSVGRYFLANIKGQYQFRR